MNDADEKLVDEYLSGKSLYSTPYRRMESTDVPPELDRAVIDAAARVHRSRWKTWGPTFALAATAVLTLSIVVRTNIESLAPVANKTQADRLSNAEQTVAPAAPPAEMLAPKTLSVEPALKEKKAQAPIVAQRMDKLVRRNNIEQRNEGDKVEPKLDEPPQLVANAARGQDSSTSTLQQATVNKPIDGSMELLRSQSAAKKAERASEAVIANTSVSAAPAIASVAGSTQNSPAAWLDRIRQLRRDGKSTEADEQWKKFVEAFPNYSVANDDMARPKK